MSPSGKPSRGPHNVVLRLRTRVSVLPAPIQMIPEASSKSARGGPGPTPSGGAYTPVAEGPENVTTPFAKEPVHSNPSREDKTRNRSGKGVGTRSATSPSTRQ